MNMTLAVLRGGGTASYQIEEEETQVVKHLGVFGATLVTFFLAEMGDKTQIATVAMAAHFPNPVMVVIGTTLGMLIECTSFMGSALGESVADENSRHVIAAAMFAVMGLLALLRIDAWIK